MKKAEALPIIAKRCRKGIRHKGVEVATCTVAWMESRNDGVRPWISPARPGDLALL